LHKLVKCVPAKRCEFWHKGRPGHAGLGLDLNAKEATCSLDAGVDTEIRTAPRPGSQAPNAPPALTFGLPGKQMVN
jgi:hypothetical protein